MTSIIKSIGRAFRRRSHIYPLQFPCIRPRIGTGGTTALEEESLDAFQRGAFYPVNIGDILKNKYQIVGKLGFGTTSTVWLARDMQKQQHVTLKVYARGVNAEEFQICQRISAANASHPGRVHVRKALDLLDIQRAGGEDHLCLVQQPMWDSFADILERNPSHRFTPELLKTGLAQVFLALDYLHSECGLVHTDIKAANIMLSIEDETILERFVEEELTDPSPKKMVNGAPIYKSRRFGIPKSFGKVVLGDLGEAVDGHKQRNHNVQPNFYRSPEVMLKADWSFPIDIWNVGVIIWDLFEGKHMFIGQDPEYKCYSTRAHLAEVIGMLEDAPLDLIQRGSRSREFFDEHGKWIADIEISDSSLARSEEVLSGQEQAQFLTFMQGMLKWTPEERKTAAQLAQDPWLRTPS